MDQSQMFLNGVQKIVYSILSKENLLQGEWHLGIVDEVISATTLRVRVDGSPTAQLVQCNPNVVFKQDDHVFVIYVNGNSKDKYVLAQRSVNEFDMPQGQFMWIKYADTPTSGMSDDPNGKAYLGLAYGKTTSTESTDYADYNWILVKGNDGNGGVVGVLSNDFQGVPTDSNGNFGNFSGAVSTMSIYVGAKDDSVNWTVNASPSNGIVGIFSGKTFSVTDMSTDTGYIDFLATKSGYDPITKRFTIIKQKQGASAITYWLVVDSLVLSKSTTGVFNPKSINISGKTKTGSGTVQNYSCRFMIAESTDGTNFTDTFTGGTTDVITKNYVPTSSNIKAIRVRMYQSGGTSVLLDEQIVPIVSDGNIFTWTMYADDKNGTNISSDPTGKFWKGVAYNKSTSTPSNTPSDYTWSFITDGWVKSGTVKIDGGNIVADSLSSITANLGSITSGSMNIGNGKYVVNSNGDLTATSATLTGNITSSSDNGSRTIKTTITNGSFIADWISDSNSNSYDIQMNGFNGFSNYEYTNPSKSLITNAVVLNKSFLNVFGNQYATDQAYNGIINFGTNFSKRNAGDNTTWNGLLNFSNLDIDMGNCTISNVGSFGLTWTNLTLTNGATVYATGTDPVITKFGNLVVIKGAVTNISSLGTVIATIPSGIGCRPIGVAHNMALPISNANTTTSRFARWTIGTDGTIKLETTSSGTISTSDWIPIHTVFMAG